MGQEVCILLGFLLVLSFDGPVQSANLQHVQSNNDAELPIIPKHSEVSQVDEPVQGPTANNKDVYNITNLTANNTSPSELQVQKLDTKNETQDLKVISNHVGEVRENVKSSLNQNNATEVLSVDSEQLEEKLNASDKLEGSHDEKNATKSGKESGRALNIDIEKYISPEFHNKNNVYILPTSPEIQKYIDPDTPDFDHITDTDYDHSHSSSDSVFSSTTPLGDFLGSKYRLVADAIKQDLDELDSIKGSEEKDDETYDVFKLIDKVENKDNNTDASLRVLETKNVEEMGDEKKGKKEINIETGRNIDYKASYIKVKTYDEKSDHPSPNNISESKEDKSPEQSVESTVKKVVKEKPQENETGDEPTTKTVPTKKPLFSTNGTFEASKSDAKSKSLSFETSSFAPVYNLSYTPATDNSINVAKRGSTKLLDLLAKPTTASPNKGMDIDNKGFNIPPSATAWSLASMKNVGGNNTELSNNTKSTNQSSSNEKPNMQVINNHTEIPLEQMPEENFIKMDHKPIQIDVNNRTVFENMYVEIITTDLTPNTDVMTTEKPLKTTPTMFNKTVEAEKEALNSTDAEDIDLINVNTTTEEKKDSELNLDSFAENNISGVSIKEIQKTTLKNENEIFKSLDEILKNSNNEPTVSTAQSLSTTEPSQELTTNFVMDSSTEIPLEVETTITSNENTSFESTSHLYNEVTTIVDIADETAITTEEILATTMNVATRVIENVTRQLNNSEAVTENPLVEKETMNIIEEDQYTTLRTKEKTIENEIITTRAPVVKEATTKSLKNVSGIVVNPTNVSLANVTMTTPNNTDTMSSTTIPIVNITGNVSTPDVVQTIEEVDEMDNVGEIDQYTDRPLKDNEEKTTILPTTTSNATENIISNRIPVEVFPDTTTTTKSTTTSLKTTTTKPPTTLNTETTKHNDTLITTDPTSATEMLSHDDNESESNPGMVAAIAISAVAAVCLVLLAGLLIVMRKRQKRVTYGQRCRPVSLDAYSLDNVSVYNSVRRKGGLRASKRSYGNPAFDDPTSISHQMNFQSLAKFNDNSEEICAEFEEIPQVTARASEVPPGCETKNRYANIIPLPETRVFLKQSDNDPCSDYINANYVTGPKNTRGYYIACQAPMDNTIDDFWRMIWEQNSRVVLMLTNLYENGVEKCADYLPPSEVLDCHRLFGDFQITLKKRDVKEKYIISSLQLKNMVSNSWREVTHLWYLGWPERGVPAEANSLIAFLIEARSHLKTASNNNNMGDDKTTESTNIHISGVSGMEIGPVVVHCSPGTGRTGTVIACDIAIRDFELTRMVDIPKIVYRVRRDRASAIQTKEQYAFIYKVITLYATKLTGGVLDSI